jgi:hypothetical protein
MNPRDINEDVLNRELDTLFTSYFDACPAPEAGPDFMPSLWQKIEARRSASFTFGRWTQAFVTAAAALCLLLSLLQAYLPSHPTFYSQTYIESLQAEAGTAAPSYFEALWTEDGGANPQ